MEKNFMDSVPPFETEKAFKKINAQVGLYKVPQNWSDLALVSNLMRVIYLDAFMGATAGVVIYEDKYSKDMFWEYRELMQIANCIRLGAEHFARHEASGLKDVPAFDGVDNLNNIQAAHKIGSQFNDFVSVSRGLLVSTRAFHCKDIQEAAKVAPERVLPGLGIIKKNEKQMLDTVDLLVGELLKLNLSLNPDDLVAIYKDTLMGIEEPAIEKSIRAAFVSAYKCEKI